MAEYFEGVPAAELSDDDLERELASLERAARDTLHHGSDAAIATHQRRLAELRNEAAQRQIYPEQVAETSDPGAPPESVGIPEYADDDSPRRIPNDPQIPAVPGDEPVGLEEYGTTVAESRRGESLDRRLAREEPEATDYPDPGADPRPAEEQAMHQIRPR